jgi:hypothetical protein
VGLRRPVKSGFGLTLSGFGFSIFELSTFDFCLVIFHLQFFSALRGKEDESIEFEFNGEKRKPFLRRFHHGGRAGAIGILPRGHRVVWSAAGGALGGRLAARVSNDR